jgi:alcohol dehydrogenase
LDFSIISGRLSWGVFLAKNLGMLDGDIPEMLGYPPFKGPLSIGHECVAEVMETGKDVTRFRKGDKVIVPYHINCGECPACNAGLVASCGTLPVFSVYGGASGKKNNKWGGMLSDLLLVPYGDAMLHKIPDGQDPVNLPSLSDNIPDAWRGVGPYLLKNNKQSVLIVGGTAKSIGLYAAGIAVAMGSPKVDYLDNNEERLKIAEKLGANPIRKDRATFTGSYDITMNCGFQKQALYCAIRCTATGGVCTNVPIHFFKGVKLPLFKFFYKDLTFRSGISNAGSAIPLLLELIGNGKFKPGLVNSHIIQWENVTDGYLKNSTKVVVQRVPIYA